MCKRFSRSAVEKLKKWVENGGYLFTEDWVAVELLEVAWGGKIKTFKYLPEMTVDASPARGATTHPYMRGVFASKQKFIEKEVKLGQKEKQGQMKTRAVKELEELRKRIKEAVKPPKNEWKIDDESPWVKVGPGVTKLLVSEKLRQHTGGCDTLACTFTAGRGKVLHIVSHFGRQKQKEDEFATQNLLLNFILEAKKMRARMRAKMRKRR